MCTRAFSDTAVRNPPAHGKPILTSAKKLLQANAAWGWGDWGHAEYRWISEDELFFAESYAVPGERIERAHLYRYNIRTGKKIPLKRLEKLVDCFYHSQIEISPDGKWILWHGGNDKQDTIDAATLDGLHHRQWPGGYWSLHSLAWTQDSKHWVDWKRSDSSHLPSLAMVHNVYRPAKVKHLPTKSESTSDSFDYQVRGNDLVWIHWTRGRKMPESLNVTTTSLVSPEAPTNISKLMLPADLSNAHIIRAILSPDTMRLALVISYQVAPDIRRHYRSLWICETKTRQMHEVGTWTEKGDAGDLIELDSLRWLPKGKSLSLFEGNILWQIPAS